MQQKLILSITKMNCKMKKKVLLTAGLLFSLFAKNSFAQDAKGFVDVKGTNVLNAGIGLGSYGLSGTGGIPFTASFEHGFSKNISAGATAGLIQKSFASDWKYTYILFWRKRFLPPE